MECIQSLSPDIIVCYNYGYIIGKEIIDYMKGNIINLHISYLPWNRGSSPNIWSFIENSPKGVSIHLINERLDRGEIIFQKRCYFDPNEETFASTYDKLNKEVVELFKEKWKDIREGRYVACKQKGKGSYHSNEDLEVLKADVGVEWSDNIAEFLQRYNKAKKRK